MAERTERLLRCQEAFRARSQRSVLSVFSVLSVLQSRRWDLNPRPPGYEPGELPDCSTPRRFLQLSWPGSDTRPNRGRVGPLRRAGNGTRTRDPNLGKVVLYQLSYSREAVRILAPDCLRR